MFELKPKVNIGDTVEMTCNIQTSYNYNIGIHFVKGKRLKVKDIRIEIMLSTGKIKYSYILDAGWTLGWADGEDFKVINELEQTA